MPGSRWIIIGFAVFLLFSFLSDGILNVLTDWLWFGERGYQALFYKTILLQWGIGLTAGVLSFAFLFFNYRYALRQLGDPKELLPDELKGTPFAKLFQRKVGYRIIFVSCISLAALYALAVGSNWHHLMLALNGQPFMEQDPVFQNDVSFYLFRLPFYFQLHGIFWSLILLALLGSGFFYVLKLQGTRVKNGSAPDTQFASHARLHLALLTTLLLIAMAIGTYLSRYALLYRAGGLFTGPGYADINGTLPLLALKTIVVLLVAGIVFHALRSGLFKLLGIGLAGLLMFWVGGSIYVNLLQRFVVAPNELEKERLYLKHHITATNKAFLLDEVEERTLDDDSRLTASDMIANRGTVNNIRLWDHEPLLETFAQIQEIRTYYDFVSVDNDRYRINGELRQIMLSPRELNPQSLPSKTWINERLTFTHGYGLTAGPVNRVSAEGLPVLFVKDLPPKSEISNFQVDTPGIYYGELSGQNDYVFVNTRQQEFDYPQGDANVFSEYKGKGGVPLDNFLKRLLFSLYLKDLKMLLSDDFTPQTRVILHRNIIQRLKRLAPFFSYDSDPYLVVADGNLVWMVDAYVISNRYPYSEHVTGVGNYLRNPVKVLVDASDGTVDFYAVQPDEPISASFGKIFPGLLKPIEQMPSIIRQHIRHPQELFYIQVSLFTTYHMLDVNTFYNKEDKWSIPVVEQKRMEPYYTVMKLPGETEEEFILMLPLTPHLKDNMAAWVAARSDGKNYGKLVVYRFPKQKLVFGPKQMVARINQNPLVSQQITLWDQSGSNVIRGTLLVIPIENALIYVQPLYLRAEDGRIPELKRVVVGYQNEIAMGLDLEDALGQIFSANILTNDNLDLPSSVVKSSQDDKIKELSNRAMNQYNAVNDAARNNNWSRFGNELKSLGQTLRNLVQQ